MCVEDVRPWLFLLDHTFRLVPVNQLIVASKKAKILPNIQFINHLTTECCVACFIFFFCKNVDIEHKISLFLNLFFFCF